eukprot:253502_1
MALIPTSKSSSRESDCDKRNSSTRQISRMSDHDVTLTSSKSTSSSLTKNSLKSVRFTTFPCRPMVAMQHNKEFGPVIENFRKMNLDMRKQNMFLNKPDLSVPIDIDSPTFREAS